jgi:hypothetical protein
VDLRAGNTEDDDPARTESWGLDRQIRAEVLDALLSGAVDVPPGQVGAVNVLGAKIDGTFSLLGSEMHVVEGVALRASGIIVGGSMFCDNGFRANGEIRMVGASIGRALFFSGARLDGQSEFALLADGLTVNGAYWNEGFRAKGGTSHVPAGPCRNRTCERLDRQVRGSDHQWPAWRAATSFARSGSQGWRTGHGL